MRACAWCRRRLSWDQHKHCSAHCCRMDTFYAEGQKGERDV